MIDPNRHTTPTVLQRLKEGSEERFRIMLFTTVKRNLDDFNMTWDDLAKKLHWHWNRQTTPVRYFTGEEVKAAIGGHGFKTMNIIDINDITHVFSAEPYIIFRPRKPYTQT